MSENKTTALARVETDSAALAMVMDPGEAVRRLKDLQDFIAQVMVKDEDYGTIPGTPKPTLYQPGAQKLAEIYGLAVDFQDSRPPIERWGDGGERPFVAYFKRAIVTRRRDGLFLGSGIGQCNSREKKYAKQDAANVSNTIEKMGCKRALIAAIISVTRSSGIFTQDLEDMTHEKPTATDAEYEEGPRNGYANAQRPPTNPLRATVSPDVERERARWKSDGGDENTERTLAGSPDPNDRALVYAWRIDNAESLDALAKIATAIGADPHEAMRTEMLGRAEKRRGEMAAGAAA